MPFALPIGLTFIIRCAGTCFCTVLSMDCHLRPLHRSWFSSFHPEGSRVALHQEQDGDWGNQFIRWAKLRSSAGTIDHSFNTCSARTKRRVFTIVALRQWDC